MIKKKTSLFYNGMQKFLDLGFYFCLIEFFLLSVFLSLILLFFRNLGICFDIDLESTLILISFA